MYDRLSPFAIKLGTQHARRLAALSMKLASVVGTKPPSSALRRTVMGVDFPGPAGLAAGFDKNGRLYPCLSRLGFGFAEIGTVTPEPEPGRSHGLAAVTANLAGYRLPRAIPLGISISMNRTTHPDRMALDYLACLADMWQFADYITVNLGVRAGPDLHLAENRPVLQAVLGAVKSEQARLAVSSGIRRPIVVKVDQARRNAGDALACVLEFAFDGLILGGKGSQQEILSTLEQTVRKMTYNAPVISVGGIRTPQDAQDRLHAGAALIQLYSGLLESGPRLVDRINTHC